VTPPVVVAILAAGAAGALVRWLVSHRYARADGSLPAAVLIVNVAGSLVAGIALGLSETLDAPEVRLILLGGFAGGLTTFGTLSVETVQLLIGGRVRTGLLSIAANVGVGIVALLAGWAAVALIASLAA
jgi:CrcB protein